MESSKGSNWLGFSLARKWKRQAVTNTLAYHSAEVIVNVKRLYRTGPRRKQQMPTYKSLYRCNYNCTV